MYKSSAWFLGVLRGRSPALQALQLVRVCEGGLQHSDIVDPTLNAVAILQEGSPPCGDRRHMAQEKEHREELDVLGGAKVPLLAVLHHVRPLACFNDGEVGDVVGRELALLP